MQRTMTDHVGVFRTGADMQIAIDKLAELQQRYRRLSVSDTGRLYNTELLEAFELGCLLDLAQATAASAVNRTESRGAHSREDFPNRDDVQWLKHTLIARGPDGRFTITYKPVVITKYQPKERKY
jgi:succinate dehydrogenase / fumarate reductase flavoprotein subunit